MSNRKKTNGKSVIDGPFSPQMESTSKTDAWKAMSAHTRVIYITSVRSRFRGDYDNNNNGKIHPSTRQIAAETGFNRKTCIRGMQELKHYRFTDETNPASLGVDGHGKAAHWRLTELPCMGEAPTRDYLSWDGTLFDDGKKKKRARKNKIPDQQMVHPGPATGPPHGPVDGPYSAENHEISDAAPISNQDQQLNDNSAAQKPGPVDGPYLDGSQSANSSEGIEEWQRNAKTPAERLPDDDVIPTFLRRGHPDCAFK
jgi:hypothetical protein